MDHPPPATLPRVIGPWAATAIVIGTVIGSGVFFTPREIAREAPYSGLCLLTWALGGLLTLAGALIYAEVATVLPHPGGNYVYLREAYGRLAGWLWGWVEMWMIRSGSIAALATAFAMSLQEVVTSPELRAAVGMPAPGPVPGWAPPLSATVAILLLAWVNMRGVPLGAGVQLAVTAAKVVAIAAVAGAPLFFLASGVEAPGGTQPSFTRLAPVWPEAWGWELVAGAGAALLAVLWPYHGWMNIGPAAGEVREPQRNLPLALALGTAGVMALYLGCNLAYFLLLSPAELRALPDGSSAASAAAVKLLGPLGGVAISGVILCSVLGALNGNLLVGPRLLFAMGEDGLAPAWLRRVHPEWKTPAAATAVLAGWSCLLVAGAAVLAWLKVLPPGKGPFGALVDFAMFGAVTFETMAVLSIFVLRWKLPDVPRPYRCPLYPWLPLAYAALPVFILGSMLAAAEKRAQALVGLGAIAAGMAAYFALGLHRRPAARAPGGGGTS
jgi:amino acid transporter